MSTKSQSTMDSLPPALKALITSAGISAGYDLQGKIESDQDSVAEWLTKAAQGDVAKEDALKDLNRELTPKTYIAANYLTAADIALYAALHPTYAKLQPPQYYTHTAVTRYFNHLQHHKAVRSAEESKEFPVIEIDIANAPPIDRTAEVAPKKKKEAPAAAAASTPAEATPAKAEAAAEGQEGKTAKKEKKKGKETAGGEAGGKKAAKAAPAPAEDAGPPKPSMIQLLVGKIVDIKRHPDADGLYVEQIDVGEETGPRTVISGLVNYIPIEKLQNKEVIVVANLKPANMRGIKSHAMLLCATHKDGKEVGLETVEAPAGSKPGDKVYFEGEEYESATPLGQLNPKKKIFETIQPGFTTLDTKEAAWINPETKSVHRLRTQAGFLTTPTLVGASLS